MERSHPILDKIPANWASLFLVTILSTFAYMSMEWIFIVTKPSFLDTFTTLNKLGALLHANAITSLGVSILVAAIFLLSRIPALRRFEAMLFRLGALLPAGIFAAMFLLWIDNFTYTMFKAGIVYSTGIWRGAYALLFLVLVYICFREIHRLLPGLAAKAHNLRVLRAAAMVWMLLVLLPAMFLVLRVPNRADAGLAAAADTAKTKPHILVLTGDGINAANMSVYGYERETTPFLDTLADTSLVAQNALTNSANTTGSLISMYTSKSPVTVGVIYAPNILTGADSYQHLPGMLKTLGYRTVQITIPHYADAYSLNVLSGFDFANGQAKSDSVLLTTLSRYLPYHTAYFFYDTGNRIIDRLRHIFYNKVMTNPYDMVEGKSTRYLDKDRMERLVYEINHATQPLFVHVHFLGTHGPKFTIQKPVFSAGGASTEDWDTDFYDDAILEFDENVRSIYDLLDEYGMLDSTILVVGSDHGKRWSAVQRIPLMIHFPNGENAGTVPGNVQIVDLAPTILDYMDMQIPVWMEGESLFQLGKRQRPIIGVSSASVERAENGKMELNDALKPPFYQFGTVNLSTCQNWYKIKLADMELTSGVLEGYIEPCKAEDMLSQDEALEAISDFFEQRGYNASSIRELISDEK